MLASAIEYFIQKLIKIKNLKFLLSYKSFDTTTEEGRSKERYRRSFITTITTVISKFVNFAIFAVSIPLTITYLGKERFGLWMTMSSIILMFNIFSDLGLGIALMNKTSEFKGANRKDLIQGYISNTFFLLSVVGLFIIVVYNSISVFIDWPIIFKLQDVIGIEEVNLAMSLLAIIFSVNLPFTIVERFQEGNQAGYLNSFWQSLGNIIALLGMLIIIWLKLGLPFLVIASFGIPTLIRIVNFCYQFYFKSIWAKPRYCMINKPTIHNLFNVGFVFFILNIFNVFGVHSDNFIISSTMGASSVGLYSILQKLSLIALIFWSFTTSLWPAYSEAIARKDFGWVRKTIKRSLILSFFSGILIGIIIILFGKILISILTKGLFEPSTQLLVGFAFYIFINGFISSFAVIFNASFLFKKQMLYFIMASLVSFGLKFVLGSHFGVLGIIWATIIGYGTFYVIPGFFIVKNAFWNNLEYRNK